MSKRIEEIDKYACKLLTLSKKSGQVLIITNAAEGWVELSASKFMPKTAYFLKQNKDVEIISARTKYEKSLPRQYQEWKIRAFLDVTKMLEMQAVTNIIALGDNVFEIEAAHRLYNQFHDAFIKTVKFRSNPTTSELTKQIKLVYEQFNHICHAPKNLTVRLHRIEANENQSQHTKRSRSRSKSKDDVRKSNVSANMHLLAKSKKSELENIPSGPSYSGTGDHTHFLQRSDEQP